MEGKKKFFDPIVWARQSFYLVFVAVALVLIGFPGPTLIVLISILAGGVIALIGLLRSKEKSKKSYVFITISLLAGISLLTLFVVGYKQNMRSVIKVVCRNNLSILAKYVTEAHRPGNPAFQNNRWCDSIKNKNYTFEDVYQCYEDKTGPCSYAMNANIPAEANALPEDMVVLFESAPGWNRVGGPNDVVTDRHKPPGANIAFADGHVEFVTPEDIPALRWTMEGNSAERQ